MRPGIAQTIGTTLLFLLVLGTITHILAAEVFVSLDSRGVADAYRRLEPLIDES